MIRVLVLSLLLLLPRGAHGQAVIVPSPVPACANGDTLVWNTATTNFLCTTGAAASQPLSDAFSLIRDGTDATKILAFEVSAIATGTTRTWTIPNANITVPSTIASLGANTFTGLQTLNAGLASTTGTFTGLITVTGFGAHSFSAGGAGSNALKLRNTTAGVANFSQVTVGNDADANLGSLLAFSSTYTATGNQQPNGIELQANGAGGLSLTVSHASGPLRVSTGTTTALFTSTAGNGWAFNSTVAGGGNIQLQRSGVVKGYIGQSVSAGGSNDFEMYAPGGELYLTALNFVRSTTIAADTTAAAANMVIDAGTGALQRSTSSLRYKTDVQPLNDWRWILALHPISYVDRANPSGRRFGGLAAEEVAALGPRDDADRPLFAGLDRDGRPDDVAYAHLVAVLVQAVQDLERRLYELEAAR